MSQEEEFAADEVDDSDLSAGALSVKPWDPAKIRITTKNFSLREVVQQINDGEVDLAPDFQRDYVWKERQRTRLIESVLLGIPLPAFYFNQDRDGSYQVVDGVQRLSTISLFMRDGHLLDRRDLEYLDDLHGSNYSKLKPAALRRFRSTQIVVHVIEPQTPDEVKYDIFGRVNTLGSPLSAQEIRHAMSKPRSRAFLRELSELASFDIATDWHFWRKDPSTGARIRDSGRMTNRELALRFCAFVDFNYDEYRSHSSLDAFLVEVTRRLDGTSESERSISAPELGALRNRFDRAMEAAAVLLGRAAFRRMPPGQSRRGPINRAVFESQAIALSEYPITELRPFAQEIERKFRQAFDDAKYSKAVTVGTGDPNAVAYRLDQPRLILRRILDA
ncbi:DUF262 domain-containing protein [Lysobacter sp. SG-8]|uniref:DUF262 domain-containing protein n=1 Tax=Marilutibacter penaei TaxID=2759900 RepID=A0A7W3U4M3_9GAMM|nr:DUF262 domain-containing protein [Lysobacter penaei]MBB1088902.1 DUF262 domain-containing protein [Lysobacter penaei]